MKTNRITILITLGICLFCRLYGIPWPIASQNSAHPLMKTYGDWNGLQIDPEYTLGFHTAVDIPADSGTPVYAVIDGVVSNYRSSIGGDQGFVNISTDTLEALAWHYGHIHPDTVTYKKGDSVHIGDSLGCVARFQNPDIGDHLHFHRSNNDYGQLTGYCNPLDSLSPSPSQTPFILDRPPGVPHHPKQIFYVKDKSEDTTGYCYERSYLRDSVDIIVFALTTIEENSNNGIFSIGYGVEPVGNGDNIPFRKMLEMRDTITVADTLKYYLTYADSLCAHFYNFYIVTNCSTSSPQPGYGLSNIAENCWPTKIDQSETANADSIEDAKFPDGYYVTTIKVWSHSGDSAVVLDTVLVDNFNPKVKETYPPDWFAFVPTKQHKVWCLFSEVMDTATLDTNSIKIQSLKADSFSYPITNITYVDSTFKLILEVDSFRLKDTVQVRLSDSVTDLAGKSIENGSKQTVAYSWTFVVGVMQLTDNNVDDIYPDVHHGNVVWTLDSTGNDRGEIMFYEFYDDTTYRISPGTDNHTQPFIHDSTAAWIRYISDEENAVYYYDGSSSSEIASANRGRYSMEISDGGVVWRAYRTHSSTVDTIWIEFYNPDSDQVYTLDDFLDYDGRYEGRADIDGNGIVWDHDMYPDSEREIYYYCNGDTQNISSDTSHIDGTPDISYGQIAWLKQNGVYEVWFHDGANEREIAGITDHTPQLHNGIIAWLKGVYMGGYWWYVKKFDGRNTSELASNTSGWVFWPFQNLGIHNDQLSWVRLVREYYASPYWYGYFNASYYDGEYVHHLTDDTLTHTNRIELHDGFVVFDNWDGNDYEIYLYIGDTLFTPPAIAQNLNSEIIEAKASDKQVKLTWNANSEPDLSGYNVYRSDSSYLYDTIPYDSISTPDTTFTDTLPMDGMNYYVITAYDNAGNESGFSNQAQVFSDVFPPSAPYIAQAEKSDSNVVLTWNEVTTDTLGDTETMEYYIVYRDTAPDFVPSPSDSIGAVIHPDTAYSDTGALNTSDSYYYLVMAVDSSSNKSKKSNMAYKLPKFFNENPAKTDKNWVSLP